MSRLKKKAWINYDSGDSRVVQLLNEAIEYQSKVKIEYNGAWKEISPFALGTSKDGNTVVKCYTVPSAGGQMDGEDNGLNVKSYRIDKITNIKPMPNDSTDKGKYNENLDALDEYDDLQNTYDKNYGTEKYVAKVDNESRLTKKAEFEEEYGPDDVYLKRSVEGYPAGTQCTIFDIDGSKITVQVNDDGHEIVTTKGNLKRVDGQKLELWAKKSNKIKTAENDDEDFEGLKNETIQCINNMKNLVNEWNVRDILTKFTSWGFYKGEEMASLDEKLAKDVCDELINYVNSLYDNDIDKLYEVYDIVYRYYK